MANGIEKPKPAEQTVTPPQQEAKDFSLEKNEQPAEDLLSADVETRVADFADWQASQLTRIDAEATQGESSVLSNKELVEAKKETGLVSKLADLKQKTQELLDSFKEKIIDFKVSRVIKESRSDQSMYSFYTPELRKVIASLKVEQIMSRPELLDFSRKIIINGLNAIGGLNPSTHWVGREIKEICEIFKNQPEVVDAMLNEQEINQLREKIFYDLVMNPNNEFSCLVDDLRLDLNKAKALAAQALATADRKTIRRYHCYSGGGDYFTRKIKELSLDPQTVKIVALNHFATIAETFNNSYFAPPDATRFKESFLFSEQDFKEFLEENEDVMENLMYRGLMEYLRAIKDLGSIYHFKNYFEQNFNLKINYNRFEAMLENSQFIKEFVLDLAARGNIMNLTYNLERMSGVSLENILSSPQGQEALYQGIQLDISQGGETKEIKSIVDYYHLDIIKICSDPRTLKSVRDLFNSASYRPTAWPADLIEYLNIKDEEISDLKVPALLKLLYNRHWEGAFELMDSCFLTDEQKIIISKDLFGEDDKFSYLEWVKRSMAGRFIHSVCLVLLKEHQRFSNKTPEQLEAYAEISQQVVDSPSQEMIRIKDQLIEQILATDDPRKTYQVINNIFIQNNLPMVGKVERIVDALNPDAKIAAAPSPVLHQASPRLRKNIIFQDLLKVHIESGNRSLKTFLSLLKEADPLTEKMNQNNLSDQEKRKLAYIFRKLKTIADTSLRGQQHDWPAVQGGSLNEDYAEICSQLGVKPGQTVSERVVEMFARPLNYQNIGQILAEMGQSRQQAEARGRSAVASLNLQQGDLVKGVKIEYIDNILQNGSVAKEFLGAVADSDSTPFDTDVELLRSETKPTFEENYAHITLATDYGNLIFVVKDRGQFQKTTAGERVKYDRTKYELFKTGSQGENHFGIRTGFPCTEIDFMIYRGSDVKERENLFYSIAQNGYYIPVVDETGQTLFSPQIYDEYRKVFAGAVRFEGQDMSFVTSKGEVYYSEINSIIKAKEHDNERLAKLKTEIRSMVLEVLSQHGINLKGEYDDSLLGAELLDIGSTGRGTNAVGEGDFDFNLKLDAKDFDKVPQIAEEIKQRLGIEMTEAFIAPSDGNNNQLRFFGSNVFSQQGLDIDIGFVKKSDLNVYASHDALADKLNNLLEKRGQKDYDEAVANILLAKKWLKEGGAYKKGNHGDGGLGGVGVENLILAYNGNIKQAFRAFYEAAKNSDGSIKSFEQFKTGFKILDAGLNLRYNTHDNFVLNMNEAGYQKMIAIIKDHFSF